jgi:hypothetical protein
MIMTIFAGIAEFERDLIRERTDAGRADARKRGVRFGRPKKMNEEQLKLARRLVPADERYCSSGERQVMLSSRWVHLSDLPCEFNRWTQHLLAVYWQGSGTLKFFAAVG